MLLTGTYPRTIDEKNRVSIPSKLRDLIVGADPKTSGLYVGPGQDGCIALFPPSQLRRLAAQLDKVNYTGEHARKFRRYYFSHAEIFDWDKQGRIRIREKWLVRAEISVEKRPRDVVLAGVQRHLEIWAPECWERFCAEAEKQFDEIAEGALDQTAKTVKRVSEG